MLTLYDVVVLSKPKFILKTVFAFIIFLYGKFVLIGCKILIQKFERSNWAIYFSSHPRFESVSQSCEIVVSMLVTCARYIGASLD